LQEIPFFLLGATSVAFGYSRYSDAKEARANEGAVASSLLEVEKILEDPGYVSVLVAAARARGEPGRPPASLRDRVRLAASEAGIQIADAQESRQKVSDSLEETNLTLTIRDVSQDRLARFLSAVESGKAGVSSDGTLPVVTEAVFKPSIEGLRYEYKEARLVFTIRSGGGP